MRYLFLILVLCLVGCSLFEEEPDFEGASIIYYDFFPHGDQEHIVNVAVWNDRGRIDHDGIRLVRMTASVEAKKGFKLRARIESQVEGINLGHIGYRAYRANPTGDGIEVLVAKEVDCTSGKCTF